MPTENEDFIYCTDSALIVVKSENLPDWYTIELAEHDHRHWMKPTEYGASMMYSGRISDADVEGTSYEMVEIAAAIENGHATGFRRCSATPAPNGEGFYFSSPRNSRRPAFVTLEIAKALAADIRQKVVVLKAGEQ